MGMFDKYDRINPEYIPNNVNPELSTEYVTIDSELPRPLLDLKKRKIGYTWQHGEIFDFPITANDMIAIRSDSIIYNQRGKGPDIYTVGKYEGQQAYNTVDAKSWTYVGRTNNLFMWVEDEELAYPIDGDKSIMIYTDVKDSNVKLEIFDFRWELIHTLEGEKDSPDIVLYIDKEISEKLIPGLYYATIKICSDNRQSLKSKFMILIN